MSTSAPPARRGLTQWAGLGGIAYVVLFIGGAVIAYSGSPDTDAPPAKVISYYSDSGHRDKVALGWGVILLGVFFLLWFLAALRQTLRRIDRDGFLTTLAMVGGTTYAALTLAGISLDTAIRTMSDDTYRDQVYPGLIHAGSDAGYVIHAAGGIGAGALIIGASLAVSGAGLIPRWAGRVGVAFGILALGSIFFFPQALIALWLVIAGWLLFRAAPASSPVAP